MPQLSSTYEIAKLFEVTPRYIRKLRAAGVLENARGPDGEIRPGKFALAPAIRAYVRYLTSLTREEGIEVDLAAAKLVKVRAQAEIEVLRLKTLRNEVHPGDVVSVLMNYVLGALARRAKALPNELARELVGETQISKIIATLTAGINRVLEASTGVNVAEFARDNAEWLATEGLTAEELEIKELEIKELQPEGQKL